MFTGVLVLFDIVDDEIEFESISVSFRKWVTFNCDGDMKEPCTLLLARLLLRIIYFHCESAIVSQRRPHNHS